MVCQITLPFWPTSLDCLSWSKDNIIAVGGGDQIGILTPRLKERGPNGTLWDSTVFKANAFTAEEVPLFDPLSFKNFSAGEELSLRHVQALEWSSPGLARFKTCVLAVLSSNHVLSIWECDGKSDVASNWKRSVIINHALKKHYDGEESNSNGSEQDRKERSQISQRIRAFAWSPPLHKEWDTEDGNFTSDMDYGQQFLAVSTECEDIILLRVRSPHDVLHPELTTWQVEAVYCFSSRALPLKTLNTNLREEYYDSNGQTSGQMIADHLAWGPWKYEENSGLRAPLAFICNGRLCAAGIDCIPPETKLSSKDEYRSFMSTQSDLTGPLKFVPKTCLLIAFAADRVFCVDTSAEPTEESCCTHHHLDDRWDEISGVSFHENGTYPPLVHIASHLSSSTACTTVLPLPLVNDEASSKTLWQEAINASKATFSAQYNLEGHVQERTWGIATSPMGEFIATATTMLPSDAVAYMTPSDYRTIININREVMPDHENILPIDGGTCRPSDVTAEVLLFGIRRYLDRQSDIVDADKLVQSMSRTTNLPTDRYDFKDDKATLYSGLEAVQMARLLRTRVIIRPEMRNGRFKLLADTALGQVSTANQDSKQVIQRLVSEVLQLSDHLSRGGELSKKIRRVYNMLKSKLFPEELSTREPMDAGEWNEECSICHTQIPFESVRWAKCGSGHQFSRCALTFLAIQEPGLSKYCAICKMKFLNEWRLSDFMLPVTDEDVEMTNLTVEDVPSQETCSGSQVQNGTTLEDQPLGNQRSSEAGWVRLSHNEASTEPSDSLARILFAAFDICIYCGGKFAS